MRAFLLVLPLLLLTACIGGDAPEPRLEGERRDVMIYKTNLTPSPAAKEAPLRLPPAFGNKAWPQSGGNPAHAPAHVALADTVAQRWRAAIGGSGSYNINPPVVSGDTLFVFNTKGQILALDAANGEKRWQKELPLREEDLASFTGGLAVQADHLFVTTATGEVFALNTQSGDEIWKTDLKVPLRAAPTFYEGGLFVTSVDNRLFAINAVNGKLVWTHSGAEESLSLLGGAAPAAAYGVVAAAYSGGDLYILKGSDGQYLWHDAFASNTAGDPFSGLNAIIAPPVLADGIAYAVNVNGRLTAFHLQTGQRLWNVNLSAAQMPWVAGFGVFVVTDNGELVALNRKDGAVRWINDLNTLVGGDNAARTWVGPVLAGGRLIVASSDGYALSFSPDNGEKLMTSQLMKGTGTTVPPVVAGGRLFFLTTSGHVIAYE